MSVAVPGGEPVAGKRPSRFEVSENDKLQLMSTIHGYYKVAFDRLPLSLIPRVHEAGLYVGFLDPVLNILVNTILSGALPDEKEVNQEQRRRAKKRCLLDEKQVNHEERRRRGKKRLRSQPDGASKDKGMEEELEEGIDEELDEDVQLRDRDVYDFHG